MGYSIQPLVVTPQHNPTESLLGYALRISEKNGYDTPWHVMSYAGITRNNMDTAGFPIEKLAAILGKEPKHLEPISYCRLGDDGKREFRILGQSLGHCLKYDPLRLDKPQFCPTCVQEQGFLDAIWDLSFVMACPVHRRTLANKCPQCGIAIGWFRPGILTCKCGSKLVGAPTEEVNEELAGMMAIIKEKVHGKPLNANNNTGDFPIRDLECVPLHTLLVIVDVLGRHNLSSLGQTISGPMSIVQSAVEVLKNWPNGYYEFLNRLGKRRDLTHTASSGLRKRFEKLFHSLFKRNRRLEGVDFLHREFIQFGLEEWDEGVVDKKLLRGELVNKRFVSNSEQAARLGVRPITLKKWSEQGLVPVETVITRKQKRYIIDSNAICVMNGAGGRTLGDRQAAADIGLPVSVLKSLRDSGHYEVRHLPRRRKAFHEKGLIAFKEAVLSLGEVLTDIPTNSMSLGEVMRLRFRSKDGKSDFMREVLAKRIKVIGRTGDALQGLRFPKDSVEQFLRNKRAEAENGTWSLNDTAKYLHCDPLVLPTLINEGLLEVVEVLTGKRVTEESVKTFDAKYISLAKMAKSAGTSSKSLRAKYMEQNIPLKSFGRGYGKVDQPFMERNYCLSAGGIKIKNM